MINIHETPKKKMNFFLPSAIIIKKIIKDLKFTGYFDQFARLDFRRNFP